MMVSNVPVGVYVLDVLYFDIHPYWCSSQSCADDWSILKEYIVIIWEFYFQNTPTTGIRKLDYWFILWQITFLQRRYTFILSPQWNHICLNPVYPSLDSHYRNLTTLIAFTSTWTIILSLNCCGHKDKSWYAGFSLKNSNSWGKPWTRSYLSDTNLLPQNAGHWCDRLGISA